MDVLDIFYKHIIPEAQMGRIDCLSYYNIVFETDVMGERYSCLITDNNDLLVPTLMIKNKELFDRLLIQYVDRAIDFYDNSNFDDEIIRGKLTDNETMIGKEKVILALLFANATYEDFQEPILFLKKRIAFFENDYTRKVDLGYSEILKANLMIEIEKDIINNETPYQFKIRAVDDGLGSYEFPKIKFGIVNDSVYIYAIQNSKDKQDNELAKRINRKLYKVGMGFNQEEDSNENLKDITASFLYAINIMIWYFKMMGINEVVVPSILIERWNAKNISIKMKRSFKKIDDNKFDEMMKEQIYLQYNLTNKLIRTFLRLACHYNNLEVMAFPFEGDSCLRMKVNDLEVICNNYLLFEGYNLVKGMNREKGKGYR